jgi:hypothetical protein
MQVERRKHMCPAELQNVSIHLRNSIGSWLDIPAIFTCMWRFWIGGALPLCLFFGPWPVTTRLPFRSSLEDRGVIYSTSVRTMYLEPVVTALPSCTREPAPSPCGKHNTEPHRGATPRASTTPIVCGSALKNVVQPPSKSSFKYSRNVRRDRRSPLASYTYST